LSAYVKEHPGQPLTSTEAAKIAGLGRTSFCDFFKDTTRVTFKKWNSRRQIQLAIQLFSSRNESITVTAEVCGFPSLRVFELQCLKWTGMQPKNLRNLLWRTFSRKNPTNLRILPTD
jgi:AraC-like DNA-binding protein